MRILTPLLLAFVLSACASSPAIVPGKGAVYGVLKAQSHSQFIEKATKGDKGHDYGSLVFDNNMVDYPHLKELYAGIIDPSYSGGKTFNIVAKNNGMFPHSIAMSPGDKISINNSSGRPLTFFLADARDTFQDLSKVNSGETRSFIIKVQGNLELDTDENEQFKAIILSKKGLRSQQLSSGSSYAFEKLEPGNYQMIFWFWRLGQLVRHIQIKAGKNTVVNELLSVNTVMR